MRTDVYIHQYRRDAASEEQKSEKKQLQEQLRGLKERGWGNSLKAREIRAQIETLKALGA